MPTFGWVSQSVCRWFKKPAEPCKFGALRDELIRDQLIEKTNSARVRERLLMEDDRLTLDKAFTLALQIEEATQCAAKIAETNAAKTDVTSVPAIQSWMRSSSLRCNHPANTASVKSTKTEMWQLLLHSSCQQIPRLPSYLSVDIVVSSPLCKVVQIKVQFAAFTSSNSYSWSSLSHFSTCGVQLKDCLHSAASWHRS